MADDKNQGESTCCASKASWNSWGLYTNEADPRIFVPKQNPWMGWTVNMGHPWGMPTLGAMIAAPLLVAAGAFVANKYRQPKL